MTMAGTCAGTVLGVKEARTRNQNFCGYASTGAMMGAAAGNIAYLFGALAYMGINATLNAATVTINCLSKETECSSQTIGENVIVLIPAATIITAVAANFFSACFNCQRRT